MQTLKVGQRILNISHPDRVLFPEDGITKAELVEYYQRIAPFMLAYLKDRPINMYRLHGSIQEGYYQQEMPPGVPRWVSRVELAKEGGTVTHVVCNNAATLVYLANLDCVTLHTWLSRMDKPAHPDQMIFDLDPPEEDFEPARQGARLLKSVLNEIGLNCYLKTTGSHGLHVIVPLDRAEGFDSVRPFAKQIAAIVTAREPGKYTSEQRIEKRKGRLFIDTLRNSYGHTAVAPYSVRAKTGAPVAAPLRWEELSERSLTSSSFNIRNIFRRLAQTDDAWKGIQRQAMSLKSHRGRLEEALKEAAG